MRKSFWNFLKPNSKPENPYIPPKELDFVGPADFEKLGIKFLDFFTNLGGLKISDTVLDIGSGNGRMAYPLKDYLTKGKYYGVEIVKQGVDFCARAYADDPHMKFIHADIINDRYNPNGIIAADEYRFPFDEESMDFIFLTSVFTHMLQKDVEHYMSEIARLLKPGGTCFITVFLINDESRKLMEEGKGMRSFQFYEGHSYTGSRENPENAVAYEEEYFNELIKQNGLEKKASPYYGRWCGRKNYTANQDILIVQKP